MDRFDEQGRSPFVDPVALPFPVRSTSDGQLTVGQAVERDVDEDQLAGADASIAIVGSSRICAAAPVSMRSPFTATSPSIT